MVLLMIVNGLIGGCCDVQLIYGGGVCKALGAAPLLVLRAFVYVSLRWARLSRRHPPPVPTTHRLTKYPLNAINLQNKKYKSLGYNTKKDGEREQM